MIPRTIGARLGLFNAALVLAALVTLGGLGLVAVDRSLIVGADRVLLDELADVERALNRSLLSPAEVDALLVAEASEEHAYDLHYRVTTSDGSPFAATSGRFWSKVAWRRGGESARYETLRVEDDPHRVRVLVQRVRSVRGDLQVAVALRLEAEDEAMERLTRGGVLALPVAIVVAAALGWSMARRALAPVDAIERAARTIGAGLRGKRRLPDAGTRDELQRLSSTLNAMLDRLERAALANLAFAGDVAHEVRTPLAVARARIEEAQAPGASPDALVQALAAVDRLEVMLRSLLALARADEVLGATSAPVAPVALGQLAADVVSFFAPSAEARGIELRLTVPDAPVVVQGDAPSLSRACANLVDNAVAYGPAREPIDVSVSVVRSADGDQAVLAVADRGATLGDDVRSRLFERFWRDPRHVALRPEGSGLGLPLVQSVARGMGGEAEHVPREGGGNVFRLRLPLARG